MSAEEGSIRHQENWEEELQTQMAAQRGISKEELLAGLRHRKLPLWIRAAWIALILCVLLSLPSIVLYAVSAAYHDRGWDFFDKGNYLKAHDLFAYANHIKPDPDVWLPWHAAMYSWAKAGYAKNAQAEMDNVFGTGKLTLDVYAANEHEIREWAFFRRR